MSVEGGCEGDDEEGVFILSAQKEEEDDQEELEEEEQEDRKEERKDLRFTTAFLSNGTCRNYVTSMSLLRLLVYHVYVTFYVTYVTPLADSE